MPSRPRLILFDFDGTLVDSFAWFVRAYNDVAVVKGFRTIDPGELEGLRALGARELMRRLGVPIYRLPTLAREMRRRASREAGEFRVFDGIERMLEGLRAESIPCGIVTSNSEKNVRAVLGEDLSRRFELFVCGAPLFGKPRFLRRALRAARTEPAHALYVGDEPRDQEAAHAVGMRFAFASWGFARAESLAARPLDRVLTKPEDLLPLALGTLV